MSESVSHSNKKQIKTAKHCPFPCFFQIWICDRSDVQRVLSVSQWHSQRCKFPPNNGREQHRERQKQGYLVVSRCLSRCKMSRRYLFPSARLLCLQLHSLSVSLSLYLTLSETWNKVAPGTRGGLKSPEAFSVILQKQLFVTFALCPKWDVKLEQFFWWLLVFPMLSQTS